MANEMREIRFATKAERSRAETNTELPALPVTGGRSSAPESTIGLNSLFSEMAAIQPDFEIKLLEVLEHLGRFNADLSYALDNIVQLGNTDYQIFFNEEVSDDEAERMLAHLKARRKKWYSHSGGLNSLINDLLAQVALMG